MITTDPTMFTADGGEATLRRQTVSSIVTPIFTDNVPDSALGLAVNLANYERATLTVVGMEQVPFQTPLDHPWPAVESQRRARIGLETVQGFPAPPEEVTAKTLIGHDLTHMILSEVDHDNEQILVLDQTEAASSVKSRLGDPLDSVFETGRTNAVLTNRAGQFEDIGSILVPISGGPHSGLAIDVAVAVAADHDAWIELFHVIAPDANDDDRERGQQYLDAAMDRLDGFERADTWMYEGETVAGAIIDQTPFYDITIIGAPRRSRLRRFVFGSKTKEIQERADSTVITVHAAECGRSWFGSITGQSP